MEGTRVNITRNPLRIRTQDSLNLKFKECVCQRSRDWSRIVAGGNPMFSFLQKTNVSPTTLKIALMTSVRYFLVSPRTLKIACGVCTPF